MRNNYNPSIEDVRFEKWRNLSRSERLAVLQTVEDVYASTCNRKHRIVKIGHNLGDNDIAEYVHPKYIYIKKEFVTSNNPHSSYNAVYSVLHEGYHAFQKDCIDEKIQNEYMPSADIVELWKKNFEVYNNGSLYNKSFVDYRFQPVENDAYNFADSQFERLRSVFRNDSYFESCVLGYKANRKIYTKSAKLLYGDDYIQKIANGIANCYNEKRGLPKEPYVSTKEDASYKSLDEIIKNLNLSKSESLLDNKNTIIVHESER